MNGDVNRRAFLGATASAGAGLALAGRGRAADKPAFLGGTPVRNEGFHAWPLTGSEQEAAVAGVARSGLWNRHAAVEDFELAFAKYNKAGYCVATSSGTASLYTSLGALGVGPGDEVIVPPYTFVATVNVALLHYAMPVFVDSDRQTFMMDPAKLEAAITERTAAIIPVHIGGSAADLDTILEIANRHNVPVIEDACQAHCGQWRGRGLGSWGTAGCFSFQVSKNLCSGEGGAILTNDEAMANKCYAFHNNCRRRKGASPDFVYQGGRAGNLRMTEFQGALLASQMAGIEQRAQTRQKNALYLSKMLRQIPGIEPATLYDGCTRSAYHLYMFRFHPEQFDGLSRNQFVRALRAEGIPCSTGYHPLNKATFIQDALNARPFVRVYGKAGIDNWAARNECPENDKLCEEAVWFMQNMLLGPRSDMDQIVEAILKIRRHAADVARA